MISYLLFYKIAQLFTVMFFGFLIVKFKVLKGRDSIVLSKFCLYLLLPAVMISSFESGNDSAVKQGLLLAFGTAIVVHILLFAVDVVYNKLTSASGSERASIIYSNAANLIIPIVGFLLGDEWVVYCTAFAAVQIIFIWTQGVRLFKPGTGIEWKKILLNPCMIGVFIGVAFMLCNVTLPVFVKDVATSLSSMVGNVGMLIAGMLMAEVDFKKIFSDKRVYRAVAMRMLICPALVMFLLKAILLVIHIPHAEKILFVTFLSSMTPSASMVTQLSQVYNADEEIAVSVNILSTLICIVTMPVFVMLY